LEASKKGISRRQSKAESENEGDNYYEWHGRLAVRTKKFAL